MEDVERRRREFPFLDGENPVAYLDNGASTQKPRAVIDRMRDFAGHEYANVHRGIHELSERATAVYEAARERSRSFFNAASAESIVFVRGTTEAVNLVAASWGGANVRPGDTILLTELEHHSNMVPWQQLAARQGAVVKYVPVLENGAGLDLEAARALLAERPRIFAFTHISNTMAVETPAQELCRLARKNGVTTLIDAAQSAAHIPVDVEEIGCDFLVCSAHKMCGPTGIGILYGRREILETMPPWQFGGEMVDRVEFSGAKFRPTPARFEAGTPAIIESAGLHAALDFVDSVGLEKIAAHSSALAEYAAEKLRSLQGVRVFGPKSSRAHLVTFAVEGVHAHDLAFFCNDRRVAIRAGHHCAQPLMRKLGAPASARASFHFYNTPAEADRLVDAIAEAIRFFNP
jgi:cysteine desulfurase/selenocysteine lyase